MLKLLAMATNIPEDGEFDVDRYLNENFLLKSDEQSEEDNLPAKSIDEPEGEKLRAKFDDQCEKENFRMNTRLRNKKPPVESVDQAKYESAPKKHDSNPAKKKHKENPKVHFGQEEPSYPDTEMGYLDSVVYEDGDRYDDPTGILPGTEDYAGPLNFQLFLNTEEKAKRSWLYSTTLKKLYIDINKVVCVQFKLKQPSSVSIQSSKENLMLRALPVYSAPEFLQEPVCRCPVHVMTDKSNGNGASPWLYHVLRAEHHEAQYHMNRKSQRNSVVVPVHNPALGSEFVTIMYKFSCKTSCAFGLNRRPIHVIFTLETANGDIIGRRKLLVKVCSCPKRDLHRDEIVAKSDSETNGRKRRIKEVDNSASFSSMEIYSPPSKEIKMESIDEEEPGPVEDDTLMYSIPSFNILGKHLYINTLELLHSHFIGISVRNDSLLDMHPVISHFGELLDKIKGKKHKHETNSMLSFTLPSIMNHTSSSTVNITLSDEITNEALSTEVVSD